jgi:methylated-DNA-[protein]-cysteine S-methyltransferase
LSTIPSGADQSYGDVARQLKNPQAVRAVGAAVGRNPLSIIVPCHRVLGAGGQLTGYAGGLWRKQALLKLEGHPMAQRTPSLFSE